MRCTECLKVFNEKSSMEKNSSEASHCFLRVHMARQRKAVMEWRRQGDCFVLPDLGDTPEVGRCTIGQDTLMTKLVSEIQSSTKRDHGKMTT
jgi:hypothetical protein